jgi:hypothetical protein
VVYLKSTLVGLLALLSAGVLILTVLVTPAFLSHQQDRTIVVHLNVRSLPFWLLAMIIFSAGFFWGFRRLSK